MSQLCTHVYIDICMACAIIFICENAINSLHDGSKHPLKEEKRADNSANNGELLASANRSHRSTKSATAFLCCKLAIKHEKRVSFHSISLLNINVLAFAKNFLSHNFLKKTRLIPKISNQHCHLTYCNYYSIFTSNSADGKFFFKFGNQSKHLDVFSA